jgi:hypothetical protein
MNRAAGDLEASHLTPGAIREHQHVGTGQNSFHPNDEKGNCDDKSSHSHSFF